jgi:hypothetical protein
MIAQFPMAETDCRYFFIRISLHRSIATSRNPFRAVPLALLDVATTSLLYTATTLPLAGARLHLKSAGPKKGGIFLNPKPDEFTMRIIKIYFLRLTHIFFIKNNINYPYRSILIPLICKGLV